MAKGQSALEYMMTYGWAILIIVIVAVILYSMGIFNPRASVTASSSGFSPFAVSAAICQGSGLTVAFAVGGLPNGATSVSVTHLYLSSPTGFNNFGKIGGTQSTSIDEAVSGITEASGDSFTISVASANCTSSGIPFTASGALTYTYTTSAGGVTTNATGTIAGTSS